MFHFSIRGYSPANYYASRRIAPSTRPFVCRRNFELYEKMTPRVFVNRVRLLNATRNVDSVYFKKTHVVGHVKFLLFPVLKYLICSFSAACLAINGVLLLKRTLIGFVDLYFPQMQIIYSMQIEALLKRYDIEDAFLDALCEVWKIAEKSKC